MLLVAPPFFLVKSTAIIMTAGTSSSSVGYGAGLPATYFGSISAEPIDGYTLGNLSSDGGNTMLAYNGDVASMLSGKTLYVDDVPYSLAGADYEGYTYVAWYSGSGPSFVGGYTYAIRIE